MQYTSEYMSPVGKMLLASDSEGVIGIWYDNEKYYADTLEAGAAEQETPAIAEAKRWLDVYFSGKAPDFTPPLHMIGTDFQRLVWKKLLEIPFGQTTTYGTLAGEIAAERGFPSAPRAVGSAVGHNHINIIVPCHRVIGADGSLTGYAGGLDIKRALLRHEKVLK